MKINKGFTLVELLAVIAILGAIATVATMSITGIIEKQEEELLKEQIANLKDSAQSYYINSKKYLEVCPSSTSPSTLITMNTSTCSMRISVNTLVQEKYFENKNNRCDVTKNVLIYKTSQTSVEVYVPEDVCKY